MNAMSDSAPADNADLAILSIPDISSWSWSCILHDPDPDPAFFMILILILHSFRHSCWSSPAAGLPIPDFSMSLKSRRSHRHFIQSSSQNFDITWHLSGLRVIPPGWSILGRSWQQQWSNKNIFYFYLTLWTAAPLLLNLLFRFSTPFSKE